MSTCRAHVGQPHYHQPTPQGDPSRHTPPASQAPSAQPAFQLPREALRGDPLERVHRHRRRPAHHRRPQPRSVPMNSTGRRHHLHGHADHAPEVERGRHRARAAWRAIPPPVQQILRAHGFTRSTEHPHQPRAPQRKHGPLGNPVVATDPDATASRAASRTRRSAACPSATLRLCCVVRNAIASSYGLGCGVVEWATMNRTG